MSGIVGIGALSDLSVNKSDTVYAITAAETLPHYVGKAEATIPLASANSYTVTLPGASSCAPGMIIVIVGRRASGSYTDGVVSVTDGTVTLKMDATGEFVAFQNLNGVAWNPICIGTRPSVMPLISLNGTLAYIYTENDGTLNTHTSVPIADADGAEVGSQS